MNAILRHLRGASIKTGCAALVFLVLGTGNISARDTGVMGAVQTHETAQKALLDRDFELATQIAHTLIKSNPNDVQALLILATVHTSRGQIEKALPYAKRAYRAETSATKVGRFTAATLAARGLARDQKFERAKLWMRRAINSAPTDQLRAQRIQEFKRIRQLSPWSTRLSFAIEPSDNINNGTEETTIILYGLPFTLNDTEPLPGAEISFGIGSDYRIWQNRTNLVQIGFNLFHREALITDDKGTDLRGRDFRYTNIGVRLRRKRAIIEKSLEITDTIGVNAAWYSEVPYQHQASISRTYRKRINPTQNLDFTFGLSRSLHQSDSAKHTTTLSINTRYVRALPGKGVFEIRPYLNDARSDSNAQDQYNFGASLHYSPFKAVLNSKARLSLDLGTREFRQLGFTGVKRSDAYARAKAEFTLSGVSYFGFSPSIHLTATRTKSNVVLYDSTSFGAGIGLRSAF
ncbi:hypothetical protein GCM10007939_03770 [Amylibacter marinus]|uniref:Tetratricopeptide repeat-containing protein n=1 Tax=Amylibacter marinus TaxID=1475483 RepID=A0ABQ5VSC8_9RHOB|nr:hypothetical protein [Amylibacter marinus]GLQ34094.1 hypothetical protein GCM10007939_03770 [Amylibacter marinus]